MRLAIAFASLLIVACGRSTAATERDAGPSAPPMISAQPAKLARASIANTADNRLSECIDLSAESEDLLNVALSRVEQGVTKLTKPCAAQFADRKPLATCASSIRLDGGLVQVRVAYFDYESVGENDENMSDCLKNGGDWQAVSRESREWHSAKLEFHQRELKKLQGK